MRIDLPCCGFKNCRHSFDGNCTKPSEQGKCEYWYLLHEEPNKPNPHWTPFQVRELTDEEREKHPDWGWILDGDVPEDGQEILVSRGNWVTTDTFLDDGECYLDGGWEIEEGMAWMPLPSPYQPEEESE